MKAIKLILFASCLCLAATVHAQNLTELQRAALVHRDLVKTYEANVDQQIQNIREIRGNFLPSVDFSYTLNRLRDNSLTALEYKQNDRFLGSVTWNIFAGFKDNFDLKTARVNEEIDRLGLNAVKQDIFLNTALLMLEVYRNQANQKVAEDAVALYRDRYREVALKHQVGILTKSDLLRIKVELDNAEQEARRAQASVQKSINALMRETGEEISLETLDFSCLENLPEKTDYTEMETLLLKNRSELLALEKANSAARFQVQSAKAQLYPRADVSANYRKLDFDDYYFGSSDLQEDDMRLQATVSINIFDGLKKYSRIRHARIEEKKSEYQRNELENTLKTLLHNTLLDLEVAFDNLQVARSSRAEAEENLRVTDLAFKQGLNTSSDILDAIFYLSRARFNVISAYTQVFGSHFELQRQIEGFDVSP
jgi:outer membrane protein TolC